MKFYNIFVGNCLDSSLKVINVLSYDDLTMLDEDMLIDYVGIKLCEYSQEEIRFVERSTVKMFAGTEEDFDSIKGILNQIN